MPPPNVPTLHPPPPADEAAAALRKRRFEQPVDAEATAAAVRQARRVSFAAGPHRVWRRDQPVAFDRPRMLDLYGGAPRDGSIGWWRSQRGRGSCLTVDRLQQPPVDVDADGVAMDLLRRADAREFDSMHAAWECGTWSPALSLPPGGAAPGTPPLGPYRDEAHPGGKPGLQADVKLRCTRASTHMKLAISLGYKIHDQGGKVTFENSPDCRDSVTPWHVSMEGYSSRTQFPCWEDPDMLAYIAYTKSVRLPSISQTRQMHHSATARPSLDGGVHLTRPRVHGCARAPQRHGAPVFGRRSAPQQMHHSATARPSLDGGVHLTVSDAPQRHGAPVPGRRSAPDWTARLRRSSWSARCAPRTARTGTTRRSA